MADKYLNNTGLQYYHNRIKTLFADKTDFDNLADDVADLEALNPQENVIEVVQKNGTALPISNKTVNVTVPVSVSELTNDGDGDSPFATEDYVDENGGKIDKIKVNNVEQTITDKTVNITVPEDISDLNDDVGIQTANDVASAISTALANGNDPYQTESDVDDKISTAISSVYRYKGSVATYNDLPASGNTTGDVWDVQDTGINYAWNGTGWDPLGASVDTSTLWSSVSGQTNSLIAITTAEIDTIVGA